MQKKLILGLAGALFLILNLNFVSAGLCKGYDGYYHDCNDYYGYSEYHYNRDSPQYETEYYKEVIDNRQLIESRKEGRWGYETEKIIILEQKEIEREKKIKIKSPKRNYQTIYLKPSRRLITYDYEPRYKSDDGIYLTGKKYKETRPTWEYKYCPSPSRSDWRYKKPYRYREYTNENPYDYYYKSRWNDCKEHFTWRW